MLLATPRGQGRGRTVIPGFAVRYISIMLPSRHRICIKRGSGEGRTTVSLRNMRWSIKRKKSQFSFKWFELGSNLLSIDRREQTAIGCFAYLFSPGRLGLETSEEDHHLYPDHSFIHSLNLGLGITISIEVNHHTTSIIHTYDIT